jgi:hypothetical protein
LFIALSYLHDHDGVRQQQLALAFQPSFAAEPRGVM